MAVWRDLIDLVTEPDTTFEMPEDVPHPPAPYAQQLWQLCNEVHNGYNPDDNLSSIREFIAQNYVTTDNVDLTYVHVLYSIHFTLDEYYYSAINRENDEYIRQLLATLPPDLVEYFDEVNFNMQMDNIRI